MRRSRGDIQGDYDWTWLILQNTADGKIDYKQRISWTGNETWLVIWTN